MAEDTLAASGRAGVCALLLLRNKRLAEGPLEAWRSGSCAPYILATRQAKPQQYRSGSQRVAAPTTAWLTYLSVGGQLRRAGGDETQRGRQASRPDRYVLEGSPCVGGAIVHGHRRGAGGDDQEAVREADGQRAACAQHAGRPLLESPCLLRVCVRLIANRACGIHTCSRVIWRSEACRDVTAVSMQRLRDLCSSYACTRR